MKENKKVPTNCRFCGYQCALIATVQDERVVKVQPDYSKVRFPYESRVMSGCKRWTMVTEIMDHPQRINYPMKRVGERGSGKWQRISWDQALDEIAEKIKILKEEFGPEVLATSIGGPHTTYWPLHRFMNLFGSPNNMGIGQICWNPGVWSNTVTYGWTIKMELDPSITKCAMLWAINPADSDNCLFWNTIQEFVETGKPLIVVDPRRTRAAELATLWLPVRPGTDVVLALGLLHIVITENLYNKYFVENWCHGFEHLIEHVAVYTPSYVEKITGVKAKDVIMAAKLLAQDNPTAMYTGRGIDQLGANTFPIHRALDILRAITGNLDLKGASHLCEAPEFTAEIDLELSEQFLKTSPKQLGKEKPLLQSYQGYKKVRELTMKHNKRLPMRYLTSVNPDLVWRAMLTGEPYPVRSLIVMATNPLLTQADAQLIYKALKSLDLLVVLELFQTPTSMLADYILPSAGVLERPLLETFAGTENLAYGGDKAVEPYYERRPDFDFWKGLGLRLGQETYWPWENYQESLAASLSPTGYTWDAFCQAGLYWQENSYCKQEIIDQKNGLPIGFATVSGKVEVYSELLKELGDDPLPNPQKILARNSEFPLILISGARFRSYYASSYHQIERFRSKHPDPLAELSAATARKFGLDDGSPVWVETENGKAKFVTKLLEMCDDVVSVEYGWWYPEMANAEPDLGGFMISNANALTNGDFNMSDPLIGTWTYNGIPCRVAKI